MTITHVLDQSFCVLVSDSLSLNKASYIIQLFHGLMMCTLAISQFARQSVEMYKATKQWRLNQFMNLIVMEGVLYFLAYVHCVPPLFRLYYKTRR